MPRGKSSLADLESRLSKLDNERHGILAEIRKAVEDLTAGSYAPLSGGTPGGNRKGGRRPGFKLSPEARAKIAAAQRKRWAAQKAKKP